MWFGDTMDRNIHEAAVADKIGRKLVEIVGKDADVPMDDGAGRRIVTFSGLWTIAARR